MRWTTWGRVLVLAVLVAVALWTSGALGPEPGDDGRGPDTPTASSARLPPEVGETMDLVAAGGPFPHDRDGAVFENREGRLPPEPRGFWREYTVPTPGEDDRGARRLVVGEDGSVYYTDDHYGSFRRIRGAAP